MDDDTLGLVENIRSGRDVRSSQERLYDRVREKLLPQLERRITPRVRPRLDSEDVLHEAFLRAMGALDLFESRSENAFFGWIYSIARNLILDQSKRRSVDAVHLVGGEDRGPRVSQVRSPERRAESLLAGSEAIEALLDRLKEHEAEVIRLHKLQGYSFAQIAARQGKTAGAVQRFYSRAWHKLCELAQMVDEEE